MKNTDNQSFWDRFAGFYGPAMEKSRGLYEEICSLMRPGLERNMNVLELACGTGQLSLPLSLSVRSWEATDFSAAMIAEAEKKGGSSRLHFSVQDATDLPYGAGSFDAVVIANGLHIMPEPEKAMEEIRRVLKPGGILFAPTFLKGETAAAKLRVRVMALGGFRVFHSWTEDEFAAFAEKSGFSVRFHKTIGPSLMPLCYLEAVRRD